jgi:O-antigen/teichoic acid export membrane protein
LNFIKNIVKLHHRYFSNLGSTFLSQAVSASSILILTPFFIKELGTEQFSIYGVILNLILFSTIFDFGLNVGLLRKIVHKYHNYEQLINILFVFFILLSIFAIPIFSYLFNAGIVKAGEHNFLTSVFVTIIVFQNILSTLFDVIIQSVNKIFVGKIIRIIRTIIEFVVLFFVCKTGSVLYLLISTASINILYLAALFIYSKKEVNYTIKLSNFKFSILWEHLVYSFWYFQNTIAGVLVYNAQIILISNFIDSTSVAKYLLVTRFYDVIRTGLTNFTMVLFPSISSLQANGNWPQLKKVYLNVLMRVSILVLIVFTLVLTIGKSIFLQWSHFDDITMIHLFQLYSFLIALLIIEHVPTVFLSALKFNKYPSIISLIQGILGLVLCYFLLPQFGIIGAVLASFIAFLLTNFWYNPFYIIRMMNKKINVE